jgi:hypothetical protein
MSADTNFVGFYKSGNLIKIIVLVMECFGVWQNGAAMGNPQYSMTAGIVLGFEGPQ